MKQTSSNSHKFTFKKKRKGVHAKTKHSTHKTSKHYVKPSRGQG